MMDTLVTGISSDILKIVTEDFTLYFSGNGENRKFKASNNNKNIEASLIITSTYKSTDVFNINSFKELEINNSNTMCPSFFEDGTYNVYLENDTKDKFEIYHQNKEIRDNIISRRRDVYGSFKFNGDIGYSTFIILKNGVEVLSITIQVFPTKLDYTDDYNELLREVNEELTSLVFDFIGKTFSSVEIVDAKKQSGLEFIVILVSIFDKLEKAIQRITHHPKHGVLNEYNLKNKEKCKKISTKETLKHLRKNINSSNVIEIKKKTTLDIYENQYVKYIINRIIKKIDAVKGDISKRKGTDNIYYEKLEVFEKKLNYHLKTFFRDISDIKTTKSMSLVFKMASGYKEVYFYYTLLSKGLDIFSGLYDISHKKLWNLYEIWCYIKINNIIKELGYKSKSSSIVQATSNGLTLSLVQGKEAKCVYTNENGNKLELWYNKSYHGLPTTNQRPDIVLCLSGDNIPDRVYIFDAKYRIYVDNDGCISPMEEDINIMHRYRDSIVSENKLDEYFKYESCGAYVMFPCSDEKSFENNKFYKSIEKVNIGALPMLPGSTDLMKKHICKVLNESYIEAINNNPVFDESDDYYRFKNKNVMVVNTKDKEHFEAYKNNRFYHIPASTLSNVNLGIEYLAFYQPKSKFGDDSGIYYYSRIKEYYKYKRSECSELKSNESNASDIYIRFELDEFKYIGSISSVEHAPIVFNYTTLYLLKNASTMHELYLKNRKEVKVYKVLKQISKDKEISLKRGKDGFSIGKSIVTVSEKLEIRVNNNLCDLQKLKNLV